MYSCTSMSSIAAPFRALPRNLRPARERRRPTAVSTIPLSPFLARKGVVKPYTGDTPVPPAKGLRPSALPVRCTKTTFEARPLARKGVVKPYTGDTPVPPAKGLRPSALPVRCTKTTFEARPLARKGVVKPYTGDTPLPPAKGLRPSALPIRCMNTTFEARPLARKGVVKPYGGDTPVPPAKGLRPLRQAQGRLSALPVRCTTGVLRQCHLRAPQGDGGGS